MKCLLNVQLIASLICLSTNCNELLTAMVMFNLQFVSETTKPRHYIVPARVSDLGVHGDITRTHHSTGSVPTHC